MNNKTVDSMICESVVGIQDAAFDHTDLHP